MLLRAARAALMRMREFVPRILQHWSAAGVRIARLSP